MPPRSSGLVAFAIAVVAGVLSWDLVRLFAGRFEAVYDPLYWLLGYPLMLAASFILGLGFPERPWLWALVIVGAQASWSVFLSYVFGAAAGLMPFGLLAFALLALPCVAAGYAGQWLHRRLAG
jgi:hypothetical protein